VDLSGKETILGLSINNNPGIQDPFNALPAWGFPFTSSAVGYGSGDAATVLDGGVEQRVIGVSAYTLWDNSVYAELGTYRALSRTLQDKLGLDSAEDMGRLGNNTLYWRLAFFKDLRKQAFHAGLVGFNTDIQPDRDASGLTNNYRDVGIDASYEFLGNRKNVITLLGSLIHEKQTRYFDVAAGDAADISGTLNAFKLAASYYYDQTWGGSLGFFNTAGSTDSALYSDGFANASPDSRGMVLQADWTPWGKEDSWYAPLANLRVGAQYTAYSKFNGGSDNYDGTGRNAADNNTLFLFAWLSI
jgi:hypothetical protein